MTREPNHIYRLRVNMSSNKQRENKKGRYIGSCALQLYLGYIALMEAVTRLVFVVP